MDLTTAASAFASLQNLGYIILFFIFLFEGPIVNYVAAFAASLGFFNVFIILILAIFGNAVADLTYYFIGRLGKKARLEKYIHKILKPKKIIKIKNYFKNNPGKTLLIIKLTPLIPAPGLILAGMTGLSFKKFFFYSSLISIISCFFITLVGFYSGAMFSIIFDYFKYGAYLAGFFVISVFILWWFIIHKISDKIEKI